MQFQGKLMKQTWENGKKPSFESDFGSFGPNLGHQNYFSNIWLRQSLDQSLDTVENTCEGIHLSVRLPAICLQACKFTKNELLHTNFSMVLGRF